MALKKKRIARSKHKNSETLSHNFQREELDKSLFMGSPYYGVDPTRHPLTWLIP